MHSFYLSKLHSAVRSMWHPPIWSNGAIRTFSMDKRPTKFNINQVIVPLTKLQMPSCVLLTVFYCFLFLISTKDEVAFSILSRSDLSLFNAAPSQPSFKSYSLVHCARSHSFSWTTSSSFWMKNLIYIYRSQYWIWLQLFLATALYQSFIDSQPKFGNSSRACFCLICPP